MRITYVCHARFPTEKAYGKQIAEVCGACAKLGHAVELLCPAIRNNLQASGAAYYGLPETFSVRYLHHFDPTAHWWVPGVLWFRVTMLVYGRSLQRYLAEHRPDLLYVRSPLLLGALVSLGIPVVIELHELPRGRRRRFVEDCNRAARVVCLTSPMRDELVASGVEEARVIVEGDGVALERFADLPTAHEARVRWELPTDRPVVGYVGSLVTRNKIEKGIEELIDSFVLLKARGETVFGWVVGGPPSWAKRYRALARRRGLTGGDVRFTDRISAGDVPLALKACSALAYPAPDSKHPYFQRDTSPLKLFEYLASGQPIVCADIPPIRDAVDERCVEFCAPGDAQSLADAMLRALARASDEARSKRCAELAQWYSWENRMRRILDSVTV